MARRGTAQVKKAAKYRRQSSSDTDPELSPDILPQLDASSTTTDEQTTQKETQSSYQNQENPTLVEERRPRSAEPDQPVVAEYHQAYIRDVFGAPVTDTRSASDLVQVATHPATHTLAHQLFPTPQRSGPSPFVVSGFESAVSQNPETGAAQSTSLGTQGAQANLSGSTELPRNPKRKRRNRRRGNLDRVITSVEQAPLDSTDPSASNLLQPTTNMSTNPATQLRHFRACMVCSIVKTQQEFMRSGCPNCESFLELTGNHDTIQDCTSQVYEGLIAIMDTGGKSWVVRHQRLEGYVPGIYATQVEGVLPEEVAIAAENAGVHYIPRDGSSNEAIPDEQ